jgi:hypothetical protein
MNVFAIIKFSSLTFTNAARCSICYQNVERVSSRPYRNISLTSTNTARHPDKPSAVSSLLSGLQASNKQEFVSFKDPVKVTFRNPWSDAIVWVYKELVPANDKTG